MVNVTGGSGSDLEISFLYPTSAVPGGPPFQMSVFGIGFTPGSTVYWGMTPLSTTYVFSNLLVATVPASLTASPGTSYVTVRTSTSSSESFPFVVSGGGGTAVVTSWGPQSAPQDSVDLQISFIGTGFSGEMKLLWMDLNSQLTTISPFINDTTHVSVMIPNHLIADPGTVILRLYDPLSDTYTPNMTFQIV
jgi:hypothetical protein